MGGTNLLLYQVTSWATEVWNYSKLSQNLCSTAQPNIHPHLQPGPGVPHWNQSASHENQVSSLICPDWGRHSPGETLHWTSAFILPVVSDQSHHMLAVYIVKVIKHLRRSPPEQQPASLASNRVASHKIPAPQWLMNSINAFIKVFWRPENIQQLPKYAL